ncbi:hypothetical protein AC1031_005395 [Aphanomyces cochlioides]|nr:hypothetical protein AC1031_005395 [Aphanomyces cochlioides]
MRYKLWGADDMAWHYHLNKRFDEQRDLWEAPPTPGPTVIPKRIHQIWLGPAPMDDFHSYIQSWKNHHPDWEYTLWAEREIENWTLQNQTAYDMATNFGEKSDILRYEILETFGGLYVDVDFECLKPFDQLHENPTCEFYAGLSNTRSVEINNALIGCVPNHPILKAVISAIQRETKRRQLIADYAGVPVNDMPKLGTIARTGPGVFTVQIMHSIGWVGHRPLIQNAATVVILPYKALYPLCNDDREDQEAIQRARTQPGAFAIHYWAYSWDRKPIEWDAQSKSLDISVPPEIISRIDRTTKQS